MEISSVINQMLVLLIILVVGVIASKTGVINADANKSLSRIVLNIAQSAMIMGSVMNVDSGMDGKELLLMVVASFVMYALLFVLSFAVRAVLRVPKSDRGTYQFAAMFGNVAFIGFPVIASFLGPEAVFYGALFNIPFNILIYSLGIYMISGEKEKYHVELKSFITMPLISTAVAILLLVLNLKIPTPIEDAAKLLGGMVVPSAMLIIGSSLGRISIKEVLGDWRVYAFAPLCLVVCPIIVWAIMKQFIHNPATLSVAVIMTSMPVGANTTILCMEHKGNEVLSSKLIFVTTVLSMVTIPFVLSLLLG